MQQEDLLKGINVLDLTQRLPGPLSSNILLNLGANVTKVELPEKKDAFVLYSKEDPLFKFWYDSLNREKDIIEVSHSYKELKKLIVQTDIIIISKDSKLIAELLKSHKGTLAIVEVCGSSNTQALHDINVLAQSPSFELFTHNQTEKIVSPPHLPIAGISFGQQLATTALAALYRSQNSKTIIHTKVFIDDAIHKIYDSFWSKDLEQKFGTKFLHNGKYPCYNLYRSQDGYYIALAAVEEKFWLKFIEISNLPLKIEDRFDTSDKTFNLISNIFNNLTLSKIREMFGDKDICLTTIS